MAVFQFEPCLDLLQPYELHKRKSGYRDRRGFRQPESGGGGCSQGLSNVDFRFLCERSMESNVQTYCERGLAVFPDDQYFVRAAQGRKYHQHATWKFCPGLQRDGNESGAQKLGSASRSGLRSVPKSQDFHSVRFWYFSCPHITP